MKTLARSLARSLEERWMKRTTTFPVRVLAKEIDPLVKIGTCAATPRTFQYLFSDGSVIRTKGRGKSFKLWVLP